VKAYIWQVLFTMLSNGPSRPDLDIANPHQTPPTARRVWSAEHDYLCRHSFLLLPGERSRLGSRNVTNAANLCFACVAVVLVCRRCWLVDRSNISAIQDI